MYLIENGNGYSIKGDKAYKIIFKANGEMGIDEEDSIEVESKTKYTYNELVAKLNVNYMLEQAKLKSEKSKGESEELKSLKEENKSLIKKLEEKSNKIAELELKIEELQKVSYDKENKKK